MAIKGDRGENAMAAASQIRMVASMDCVKLEFKLRICAMHRTMFFLPG